MCNNKNLTWTLWLQNNPTLGILMTNPIKLWKHSSNNLLIKLQLWKENRGEGNIWQFSFNVYIQRFSFFTHMINSFALLNVGLSSYYKNWIYKFKILETAIENPNWWYHTSNWECYVILFVSLTKGIINSGYNFS